VVEDGEYANQTRTDNPLFVVGGHDVFHFELGDVVVFAFDFDLGGDTRGGGFGGYPEVVGVDVDCVGLEVLAQRLLLHHRQRHHSYYIIR
jgi:hypothetical protein